MEDNQVPAELRLDSSRATRLPNTEYLAEGSLTPAGGADLLVPRIGRYAVRRPLGRGGFGIVWLAYDAELERHVAIKVPRRDRLSSEERVAEFLREARTAAALKHSAIVTVHDVGRLDDGSCFLVMEYIEGRTLAEAMAARRFSVDRVAKLIEEVAEAVHYAHTQRLVHRDLKPANILLDGAGLPHVADFGLAIHEQQQRFRQGEQSGTPAYMAPEQVRGESHRLDGRTDIWALGIVLYELLIGRRPFSGESGFDLVDQIERRDPKPPRQIDDSIPAELERICLKCLAKRMTDRYLTAADLAADLKHFRTSPTESHLARPISDIGETGPHPAAVPSASTAKIIPKGLRSFDAHDADFFLQLLPGPTDRGGLPESLRFWKNRIEPTDADTTSAVGLIYGPSGCGKSSLVKAGLLPRLARHVLPVYLEATADDTEARLLKGLRKQCPELGTDDLVEAIVKLRGGHVLAAGRKILIVLDQFEQWLYAHRDPRATDLVSALRQCDGAHAQCIIMVRDDFWMAASQFLRELETPILEGENSAAVYLFDTRHARHVLTLFGRAYGCLHHNDDPTPEQVQFIDQAVNELAEEGKVISVRLALFADMVKGKPWTALTLKEIGGIAGVGVTFLEETFATATAPPQHRFHQKAAQAVLKALLPQPGTNIKGHMRSQRDLLDASGYAGRPRDFEELLRILDAELRLITPTDPEGLESQSSKITKPEKYYQLTHDYLIPSLRDWLTRKQRETRRGRAELLLAERTAAYSAKPDARSLPSWWEWPSILLFTRHRHWTPPERRLMKAAGKYHGQRLSGLLLAASLVMFLAFDAHRRSELRRAQTLAESVFTAPPDAVRYTLDNLLDMRRLALPIVRSKFDDSNADPIHRLHAAFALAELGDAPQDFLVESALTAPAGECRNLIAALDHVKDSALPRLAHRAEAVSDPRTRARLEIVALHLGDIEPARRALAVRGDPRDRTALIHGFADWHGDLAFLAKVLETVDDAHFRSGLCSALGTFTPPPNERRDTVKALAQLYTQARDGGTHAAAGWALRQWKENPPALDPASSAVSGTDWFINRHGMTMVKVPAGSLSMVDIADPKSAAIAQEVNEPFYVCDREVWVDLFREFVNSASSDEAPVDWKAEFFNQTGDGDAPVQMVNWFDAVRFCNWLSRQEKRQVCYRRLSPDASDRDTAPSGEAWELDPAADGYRLPTEVEWEYACRAGTSTAFCFGDDPALMEFYAVYIVNAAGSPRPGRQKMPNAWGLFDLHGNVDEWCYDWYSAYPVPGGERSPPVPATERVYRGGSYFSLSAKECSSHLRGKSIPEHRLPLYGFRVVMSAKRK